MKYCDKCHVTIVGGRDKCPLCHGPVSAAGGDEREIFPYVPTIYNQYHFFFRCLIFASIVIGVLAIAFNVIFPGRYSGWSVFVLAGIACLWVVLFIAVHKRNNIMKNLLYQSVLFSLLAILWDYLTGWHNWSLDFAIPIIFLVSLSALIIVGKILSYSFASQLIYLLIAIGLALIIPLLLIMLKMLHVLWPAIITIAGAIITLAALLIFWDRPFKRELRRRFHL